MNDDISGAVSSQPPRPSSRSGLAPGAPWGRERVRAALGLAVWEVELAVETGLLQRLPDRRFDAAGMEAALGDPEGFRARLAAEHRLNATEAADRLGVSRQRFTRVVGQAGLEPVAEKQIRKYGTVLTVRYYRAADVAALQPHLSADIALREAATAVGRADAARKAARTRARNREQARAARLKLAAARPDDQTSPVRVLRYAAGLAASDPKQPSFLRRFAQDPAVERFATLVATCRLREAEQTDLLEEIREQALRSYEALAGPEEIRRRLGLEPHTLTGHAEMIGWSVERGVLVAWEADPPGWLLTERASQAAAEAARAAIQAQEREEQLVLKAAGRAAQLTNAVVAALFGLSEEVIAQLRPHSGRWSWEYVAQLRSSQPAWLRSETAAREEAARRTARRAGAKGRNAGKRAAWRQQWAQQLDVPVERVPARPGKPTPAAVRAAQANPPRWARDWQ